MMFGEPEEMIALAVTAYLRRMHERLPNHVWVEVEGRKRFLP